MWFISITFFLIIQNHDTKLNTYVLNIFLLIILLVTSKFTYDLLSEYFSNYLQYSVDRVNFYGFETMAPEKNFFNQPVPRSSGLARLLMILWLVLFVIYIFVKSKKIFQNIFLIFIMIILASIIFHLQSRLIFIFQIVLIFFIILVPIFNKNLSKKFFLTIILFLIPYLIHVIEPQIRIYKKIEMQKNELKVLKQGENQTKEQLENNIKELEKMDIKKTTGKRKISFKYYNRKITIME